MSAARPHFLLSGFPHRIGEAIGCGTQRGTILTGSCRRENASLAEKVVDQGLTKAKALACGNSRVHKKPMFILP
jgi:hypothetical protein